MNKQAKTVQFSTISGEPIENAQVQENAQAQENEEEKGNQSNIGLIENYLSKKFDFRYNEVLGRTEVSAKSKNEWEMLSDREENSLLRELLLKGFKCKGTDLSIILGSDFCPMYNPLQHYFENLIWDGHDHISDLANSVQAENPEIWIEYLRKWLISSIANVFDRKQCVNQTVLVLLGAEGRGKTYWLNNLCKPKGLNPYLITKSEIDPKNKDHMAYLAISFILNLDDCLKSVNKKDEDLIKGFISMGEVTCRKPYAKYTEKSPRFSSIVASVNGREFLHEPKGGRRFLPIRLIDIDQAAVNNVDINGVWAQCMALLKADFPYKFTKEDIDNIIDRNQDYIVVNAEYEAISKTYRSPIYEKGRISEADFDRVEYVTATEVQTTLENQRIRVSTKKIGAAMDRLGIITRQRTLGGKNRVHCYEVVIYNEYDIEQNNKAFKAEVMASMESENTSPPPQTVIPLEVKTESFPLVDNDPPPF